MDLIIAYDVNTLTKEGRSRLRRVARLCEGHGQRVQESLFECQVNEMQRERLWQRLTKIIEPTEDSLRVYQLRGGREGAIEILGIDRYISFSGTLIG